MNNLTINAQSANVSNSMEAARRGVVPPSRTNRGTVPRVPSVVKPRWEDVGSGSESNTRGSGNVVNPSRASLQRSERIRKNPQWSFDRGARSRLSYRARAIAQSPGAVLVAALTVVLSLGLSPLVLDDLPEGPNQVVSSTAGSAQGGAAPEPVSAVGDGANSSAPRQ